MASSRKKRKSWLWDRRLTSHNVCLAVFLAIVVLDFCLFPIWRQILMARLTPEKMIQLTQQFPQMGDRAAVLQVLMSQNVWHPLTLDSGGIFFIAFGAILGIGTWRRNYWSPYANQPMPPVLPPSSVDLSGNQLPADGSSLPQLPPKVNP